MTSSHHRRLRIPEWPTLLISLCVLLIIGTPLVNWWQMNRNPVVHVPMPMMPVPNAFDYYVKAAKLIPYVDTSYVSGTYSVPTTDPTAILKLTASQRTAILAVQPQVTALLTQGMQYPCVAPPIRSRRTLMPYLSKRRNMGRYFDILAKLSAAQGAWPASMEDSLLSMRVGADSIHGSPLIGALVGEACESIGRKQARAAVDHLSPSEAHKALAEMEDINAREVPCSQILQEEKWTGMTSLAELFRTPNWRTQFVKENYASEKKNVQNYTRFRLVFVHKRHSLARYAAYFDTCIIRSTGRFALRKPAEPAEPDDIVSAAYSISCDRAWLKSLQNEVGNRLLTMQLALQAYRGEHGAYPSTLAALVSAGYLHTLPDDPFALTGTFHYQTRKTGYLLYSLGPDCTDEGGTPITDTKDPTKPAKALQLDNRGDIVAGVNGI